MGSPEKTIMWVEGWNFWATWPLGKGSGLEIEFNLTASDWINQSYLHKEIPVKSLDSKAYWSFLVGAHSDVQGGWRPLTPQGKGTNARCSLPDPADVSPLKQNYNHKHWASQSSVSYSSKLLNLWGLWEPWIYNHSVRSMGGLGFLKVWLSLWRTKTLTCEVCSNSG